MTEDQIPITLNLILLEMKKISAVLHNLLDEKEEIIQGNYGGSND